MPKILKRYLPYLKNFKLYFFLVFIGIVMSVAANIAMAYIMQPMIDEMFLKKEKEMLTLIPLMMIGIYFVKSFGRYLQSVFTSYIGQHVVTTFRTLVLDKILSLDLSVHQTSQSGEFISRIVNDINRISYFVSLMLPEFIRELFTVVGLIGYAVYLNAMLAFYALVILPLVLIPIGYLSRKLRKISFGAQEKNALLLGRLSEMLNNAELIKTNAAERFELQKFAKKNWDFFKITMKAVYFNQLASPLLEVVGAFALAVVIFLGAKEVYAGAMSVGEFMTFLTAIGLVFQPARGLGIIYTKMQDSLAASERIFEVLDRQNDVVDGDKALQQIDTIQFEKVSLHFGEKRVLDGVDFSLRRPSRVAFVGESGSGKSSVVNLLLRFYDPSDGKILINGEDIASYRLKDLRESIALVTQRIYIFNDTVAANVAYGDEIDQKRVIEALKKANAYDFVMSLPEGIDTVLLENGENLSGGQKQRIAIARALYKDASVLVLDEATSALDNESEAKILQDLEKSTQDKIVIAIAHRLSTIIHSDTIYFFKKGRIIASGTHAELYATLPEYKTLYDRSEH